MAIENLVGPPAYSLGGLIRAFEDPLLESYETQIGATMQAHGIEAIFNPGHKYSRAIALPNAVLIRALGATESGQSGANLTTSSLAEVARAARPALVLDELGVPRREVGGVNSLAFPTVQAFAPGGWSRESVEGSQVNPTVKSAYAIPKEARAFLQYSRQLQVMAGQGQLDEDLMLMLSDAARATIEAGFLSGSGSENQPHGLMTRQAKGSKVFGNATPTRPELLDMMASYCAANGRMDRAVWICDSTMALALMETPNGTGESRYLLDIDGTGILGRPVGITDHAPAGKLLLFDPTGCRSVYWGAPFMMADRYSDNMDIRGETRLVLHNYCDIVALYPEQLIVGAAA